MSEATSSRSKSQRRLHLVGSPFETKLHTGYRAFKDLPFLSKEKAIMWFGAGLGMGALFVSNLADKGRLPAGKGAQGVIAMILLFAATALIGFKQYCYYFGGPGDKDGFFVKYIRQGSEAEQNLDIVLSFWGGFLMTFIFLPIYWFLAIALYSIAVSLRCHVTRRSPFYWVRGGRPAHAKFIPDRVRERHDKLCIPVHDVLAGWVFSHSTLFVIALLSYGCLIAWPKWWIFYVLLATYFSLYFFVLRYISHRVGPKLMKPHKMAR